MTWCLAMQMMTLSLAAGLGEVAGIEDLPRLVAGRTRAENALWIENSLTARFNSSKQVMVADIKGPAVITMIHFAMPQTLKLNRDVLLKAYWDGETMPSIDCPLVDFFCDPAGLRDEVNTSLVNKRRGFNAYFPMPFRTSAKIELVYDGPMSPGEELWKAMPCYSYVMYRTLKECSAGQRLLPCPLAAGGSAPGQARLRRPGGQGPGQVRRLERDDSPARAGRAIPSMRMRSSTSTANRPPRLNSRGWRTPSDSVGAFRRPRACSR